MCGALETTSSVTRATIRLTEALAWSQAAGHYMLGIVAHEAQPFGAGRGPRVPGVEAAGERISVQLKRAGSPKASTVSADSTGFPVGLPELGRLPSIAFGFPERLAKAPSPT